MINNLDNPTESMICMDFANQFHTLQLLGHISTSVRLIRIPNEGERTSRFGGRLKAEGWEAGYPDYLILKGNKWGAIEFKRNNKSSLSPKQKLFKLWCENNKTPYILTSSAKAAIYFIEYI